MKRNPLLLFLIMIFSLLFTAQVYASDITINTDRVPHGLVQIEYRGDLTRTVKVMVEANDNRNVYTIRDNSPSYVPLQMGVGTYRITVVQQITGTMFRPLQSETIEVGGINLTEMFTAPTLMVNFDSSMKAIQSYTRMAEELNRNETIQAFYRSLVTNYSYDFEKASNLPIDYHPVIDEMYISKKGICFDYAVLFASILRSNGIPTKLIMGYAPGIDEYHAWNEILINGRWVAVDTTYDSAFHRAGLSYTFEKDRSVRTVVKVF